ncbi:MAG: glycosyltransferase family 39 protein [Acidimicrobiia bacterium]|jgi:4-amino-4-deoxy-L-arabinose transferase-like glycosyltransferase
MTTTPDPRADAARARRRFLIGLGCIALLGLAIRVWFATVVVPHTSLPGDPRTYHYLGTNLAEGLGYVRPAQINLPAAALTPTAEFPPGLPALIAVATKLGAHSPERQALLTALLGAGTVAMVGLLARRLAGFGAGLVAAAIVAVHPLFIQPDTVLMSEGPYFFTVSAVLLAAFAVWDHAEQWWRWAVLGALIGLGALVRPEALLFIPFLALPIAIVRRRVAWHLLGGFAVACAVLAAVVAPWIVRNAAEFDELVPIASNAGVVVLGSNCDQTYSGRSLGSWDFGCVAVVAAIDPDRSQIERGGPTEVEVYDYWRSKGFAYMGDHLGSLPKVVPVRVLRTLGLWNPSAQLDFDVPEGRNRTAQTIGYAIHWVLLPFAVAGAIWGWRRRRGLTAILLVPIGVAVLDSALFYGSTKMRAAAEPSIAALAAVGMVAALAAVRARRLPAFPGPERSVRS